MYSCKREITQHQRRLDNFLQENCSLLLLAHRVELRLLYAHPPNHTVNPIVHVSLPLDLNTLHYPRINDQGCR